METILIFGNPDKATKTKMEMALLPLRIKIRYIKDSELGLELGQLAAPKSSPEVSEFEGNPIDEIMLVFAFMSDIRVGQILQSFRRVRIGPFHYKAVLTSTNMKWTPHKLLAELKEEHEAIQKGKPMH